MNKEICSKHKPLYGPGMGKDPVRYDKACQIDFRQLGSTAKRCIQSVKTLQGDIISDEGMACTCHVFQYFSLEYSLNNKIG